VADSESLLFVLSASGIDRGNAAPFGISDLCHRADRILTKVQVMWIFTKHGFFSAVCARQGDGKYGEPVDPGRIMVRARLRGHLEALMKRFPDLLGSSDIQESASTDYAYRLFVQKAAWTQVLAGLAEETDYDNFKSEVARHQGRAGAAYEHSLHEVWSVMHRLQK
jgi:hypothetical protein